MDIRAGIQARIVWALLTDRDLLEEPGADYAGLLEGMEAAQLLVLMGQVLERLRELEARDAALQKARDSARSKAQDEDGANVPEPEALREPSKLYIDSAYNIRLDGPDGMPLPLRPLVKALFILFLRHPEGIRLKERDRFHTELSDIYAVIAPNTSAEDREKRIGRLMDLTDNAFSENTSALNARLDKILPPGTAGHYQILGTNGHPRRIPLDPLLVCWE